MYPFATTFFFAVSIFLPFGNPFEYTDFSLGCHTFYGKITCDNKHPIQPNAKVVLKEKDPITPDDLIMEVALNSTLFKLYACINDPPTFQIEVYLEFYNVCNQNEYKLSGKLQEGIYTYYLIKDDQKYAIITDS